MVKDECWSVEFHRLLEFFQQQLDITETDRGFLYRDCRITLTETEPGKMGTWKIPRTRLRMEGSRQAVTEIYNRFFLRFLSAGG